MTEVVNKVIKVQLARVLYRDLAEFSDQSANEFFGNAEPKLIEVYGLTMVTDSLVKVLFYMDHTDDCECEGIVIPRGDVLEIEYQVPDPVRLTEEDAGLN